MIWEHYLIEEGIWEGEVAKSLFRKVCALMLKGAFSALKRQMDPEVYGGERLREMLTMFERKQDLLDVFSESEMQTGDDGAVKIYIGRENLVKTMDNSTLVYKPIKRDGILVGAIGVIGPTRMNYSRVIAMIDHLSSGVSNLIEEGDERSD